MPTILPKQNLLVLPFTTKSRLEGLTAKNMNSNVIWIEKQGGHEHIVSEDPNRHMPCYVFSFQLIARHF